MKKKRKQDKLFLSVECKILPMPKCDTCGTAKHVVYCGPATMGHAFYCGKCKTGWAQAL